MIATLGELGHVRVLLVDDHEPFRRGLASLLDAQPGIEVVGQASGGHEGVQLAGELRPAVVLMDLRMPDLDGAEATRRIIEQHPATRVLALTVLSRDEDVAGAIDAGACGYVTKDALVEEIAGAIRAAARGVGWLSPRAAELVLARLEREDAKEAKSTPAVRLSPEEREVLRLIAAGVQTDEIAERLHLNYAVAAGHVSSILRKLGFPTRIPDAVFSGRRGWG